MKRPLGPLQAADKSADFLAAVAGENTPFFNPAAAKDGRALRHIAPSLSGNSQSEVGGDFLSFPDAVFAAKLFLSCPLGWGAMLELGFVKGRWGALRFF